MTTLAELVADQAETVLEHWTRQLRRELAPGPVSEPELRDHAPMLLAELVAALHAGIVPTGSAAAVAHGSQRAAIGFDIVAVEREYTLLRTVLLDVVEAAGLALTTLEVRTFTELFAVAVAEGVAAYGRHERNVHATQAEHARGLLAQREADLVTLLAAEQQARERFEGLATELRTSQDRLRGAVQVLEQSRVVEQQLRREAEDANRAKDEFLAMLGHEMRNPLAPITTALQLMKLRADDQLRRERTIIERQVDHLTRLVDDLLDVSRITRGKVELERRPLDVAAVVAEAVEVASPLLEQRRHDLQISVPAGGLTVDGDRVRLAQVMSNLLTNAAKYTEPGGRIAIAATREGDDVVVRVRDNGVGIAPEMLPRVFELFAQEHQSIDRARGGLGLGLAIVRTLVALHGGSVEVHSAGHGQGSEFAVRLPVATPRASEPHAAAAEPARAQAEPHHILIVDDNVDAAEMLAATLEMLGHDIRIAHDGPSALQVVADFVPDLAVLDIGLPVMDGYELGRRLREVPRLAQLRLVALTGYGQRSDRDRSAEAGFEAHLVKPVQMALLETIITGGA